MATISFEHLLDILFVPICIQIGALIVGSFLSRLINRYLQSNVNRDSWQYIFCQCLKGITDFLVFRCWLILDDK